MTLKLLQFELKRRREEKVTAPMLPEQWNLSSINKGEFMKAFALLAMVFGVGAVHATSRNLVCTTIGDSLGSVNLIEDASGKASIQIGSEEGSVQTFTLSGNLDNIVRGQGDTLIGTASDSIAFGGGISDAVLLRVTPASAGKAFLAMGGGVFSLEKCK